MSLVTADQVAQALPATMRSVVTPNLVALLNGVSTDPIIAESIQNNFMSYSRVLSEGKYKIEDYVNAVAYVSYKHMGYSNLDAYAKTFPQRYQNLLAKGATPKDISAYVSAYTHGKLVMTVYEYSMIPVWVANQGVYQEAINTQADLMRNAQSEKVRSDAANSILTHLAKPKEAAITIPISFNQDDGLKKLEDTLLQLAETQQQIIKAGGLSAKMVAASTIIDADTQDVSP